MSLVKLNFKRYDTGSSDFTFLNELLGFPYSTKDVPKKQGSDVCR